MMEEQIMLAELALEKCQEIVDDPKIAASSVKLNEAFTDLKIAQEKVDRLYTRWTELESKTT